MHLRLRCQRGFTTVTLMGVLMVGGLLVLASFAAVDPDISLSRGDQDSKQAYGAAEAGLQWYLSRLNQDNNFYLQCDTVPAPNGSEVAPVNQEWKDQSNPATDPRKWRTLPGSGEKAQYTVELIPAPGRDACTSDQYSMIDPQGNMKIRVSGRSRGRTRTIDATLRRNNFIDFIYFTNFENLDPSAKYSTPAQIAQAEAACSVFRAQRTSSMCEEIQFTGQDVIAGPMHSNDTILMCGSATLGRNDLDKIELGGNPGWVDASASCQANPKVLGTLHQSGQLGMPPSNAALMTLADANGKHYFGRTTIVLNGNDMTVTNANQSPATQTVSLPNNGVIFVSNTSCTSGFVRDQTYASQPPGCGDVTIRGTYSRDITVAADNDILVNGNVTRAGGADGLLLGLIANNFVRVYHPVDFTSSGTGVRNGCKNNPTTTQVTRIDAAILTLRHSFIVDNWACGMPLGDLTVYGAIAQRFRGTVGTVNGTSIYTGYEKDYQYNDRLRYREPPYFLDPVQAAWRVARQTERVPAIAQKR
jgi:hypothetical protein